MDHPKEKDEGSKVKMATLERESINIEDYQSIKSDELADFISEKLSNSPRSSPTSTLNSSWRTSQASTSTVESSSTAADSDDTLAKDMSELSSINSRLSTINDQCDSGLSTLERNIQILTRHTAEARKYKLMEGENGSLSKIDDELSGESIVLPKNPSLKNAIEDLESIEATAKNLLKRHKPDDDDENKENVESGITDSQRNGIAHSKSIAGNGVLINIESASNQDYDIPENIATNGNITSKSGQEIEPTHLISDVITVEVNTTDPDIKKRKSPPSPPPRKKSEGRSKKKKSMTRDSETKPPLPPSTSPIPKAEIRKRWWSRSKEVPLYISRESYNEEEMSKELYKLRQSYKENDLNDFLDALANTPAIADMNEDFLEQLLSDLQEDLKSSPEANSIREDPETISEAPLSSSLPAATPPPLSPEQTTSPPEEEKVNTVSQTTRSQSSAAARKFAKLKEAIKDFLRRKKKKGKHKSKEAKKQQTSSSNISDITDETAASEAHSSRPLTPCSLSSGNQTSRAQSLDSIASESSKKSFSLTEYIREKSPRVLRKKSGMKKVEINERAIEIEDKSDLNDEEQPKVKDVTESNAESDKHLSDIIEVDLSSNSEIYADLPENSSSNITEPQMIIELKPTKQETVTVLECSLEEPVTSNNSKFINKSSHSAVEKQQKETEEIDENTNKALIPLTVENLNRAESLLPKLPERVRPPRRKKKKVIPRTVEELTAEDARNSMSSEQSQDSTLESSSTKAESVAEEAKNDYDRIATPLEENVRSALPNVERDVRNDNTISDSTETIVEKTDTVSVQNINSEKSGSVTPVVIETVQIPLREAADDLLVTPEVSAEFGNKFEPISPSKDENTSKIAILDNSIILKSNSSVDKTETLPEAAAIAAYDKHVAEVSSDPPVEKVEHTKMPSSVKLICNNNELDKGRMILGSSDEIHDYSNFPNVKDTKEVHEYKLISDQKRHLYNTGQIDDYREAEQDIAKNPITVKNESKTNVNSNPIIRKDVMKERDYANLPPISFENTNLSRESNESIQDEIYPKTTSILSQQEEKSVYVTEQVYSSLSNPIAETIRSITPVEPDVREMSQLADDMLRLTSEMDAESEDYADAEQDQQVNAPSIPRLPIDAELRDMTSVPLLPDGIQLRDPTRVPMIPDDAELRDPANECYEITSEIMPTSGIRVITNPTDPTNISRIQVNNIQQVFESGYTDMHEHLQTELQPYNDAGKSTNQREHDYLESETSASRKKLFQDLEQSIEQKSHISNKQKHSVKDVSSYNQNKSSDKVHDWVICDDNPVPVPRRQFQQIMPKHVVTELKSTFSEHGERPVTIKKPPEVRPRWDSSVKCRQLASALSSSNGLHFTSSTSGQIPQPYGRSIPDSESVPFTNTKLTEITNSSKSNSDKPNNVLLNSTVNMSQFENNPSNTNSSFLKCHSKTLSKSLQELAQSLPTENLTLASINNFEKKDTHTAFIDKSKGPDKVFKLQAKVYPKFEGGILNDTVLDRDQTQNSTDGTSDKDLTMHVNKLEDRKSRKYHSMFAESSKIEWPEFESYKVNPNKKNKKRMPERPPPPKAVALLPTLQFMSEGDEISNPPIPQRRSSLIILNKQSQDIPPPPPPVRRNSYHQTKSMQDYTHSEQIDDISNIYKKASGKEADTSKKIVKSDSASKKTANESEKIDAGSNDASVASVDGAGASVGRDGEGGGGVSGIGADGGASDGGVSGDGGDVLGAGVAGGVVCGATEVDVAGVMPRVSTSAVNECCQWFPTPTSNSSISPAVQLNLRQSSGGKPTLSKQSDTDRPTPQSKEKDIDISAAGRADGANLHVVYRKKEKTSDVKVQRSDTQNTVPNKTINEFSEAVKDSFSAKLNRASFLLDNIDNMEVLTSPTYTSSSAEKFYSAQQKRLSPNYACDFLSSDIDDFYKAESAMRRSPAYELVKRSEIRDSPVKIFDSKQLGTEGYQQKRLGSCESECRSENLENDAPPVPPRPTSMDMEAVQEDIDYEQKAAERRYMSYFNAGPPRPTSQADVDFGLEPEKQQAAERRYKQYFEGTPRPKSQTDVDFRLEPEKQLEAERRYQRYFEGGIRSRCSSVPVPERTPSPDADQLKAIQRYKKYFTGAPKAKHKPKEDDEDLAPEITQEMLDAQERLSKYFRHPVPRGEPKQLIKPPLTSEEEQRRQLIMEYWGALQERNNRRTKKVVKVSKAKKEIDREDTPPTQRELVVQEFLQRVKDRKKERNLHYGDTDSEDEDEGKTLNRKSRDLSSDPGVPGMKLEGGGHLAERVASDLGDFIGESGECTCSYCAKKSCE